VGTGGRRADSKLRPDQKGSHGENEPGNRGNCEPGDPETGSLLLGFRNGSGV
jgi:hypothetical protein